MKRFFLTVFFVICSLLLVGSFALWLMLSAWVPNKGKAVLIQEAERRWPVTLAIGTVQYDFFHGFVLTDVRVSHRPTGTVWAVVPAMNVQPEWVSLAALRTLMFRGRAQTSAPLKTSVSFSGRYHVDRQTASISAQAADIGIKDIGEPLAAKLPRQLVDGKLRAQLHVNVLPGSPPEITGRVTGTELVWDGRPWRLTGALVLNGSAQPPRAGASRRWSVSAMASLADAVLTNVPVVGTVTRLEGTARLSDDRIEAVELSGDALDSRWRVQGDVDLASPSLEALLSSRAPVARLAELIPPLSEWRAGGEADVRAVCRGPLAPRMWLDCLVQATIEQGELQGPKLADPVTGISGTLAYDLPARVLTIPGLSGTLLRHPVRVSGRAGFRGPAELSLTADGAVPLPLVQSWLPAQSPVTGLSGEAAGTLTIEGRPGALRYTGTFDLQDAAARLPGSGLDVTGAAGAVSLTRDALELSGMELTVNGQPLTLDAVVRPPPLRPLELINVTATAGTPAAIAKLTARVTPEDLLVDSGDLTFAGSALKVVGTISRRADMPSRLNVKGTAALEEIGQLPFVSFPLLEQWKVSGPVDVDAQFRGRWSDWPSAELRARLSSARLSIKEIPVEQLAVVVEQNNRVLRATVPSASLAEGRAVGELVIEHLAKQHRFLGQTDITGVRLEQLAAAVPAWRESTMKGQASGRLLLSGTWEDRASWRGEGWINSGGEHLGDVPLMDKLFQRAVLGALADWMGLDPLRRAKITQASLTWKLADEHIQTQDLRLAGDVGVGAVVIYLQGAIGLDQRLDLNVQPEFSEQVLSQSRAMSGIGQVLTSAGLLQRLMPFFRYHIGGTLTEPRPQFQFTPQEVVRQALGGGALNLLQNLFGGGTSTQNQ